MWTPPSHRHRDDVRNACDVLAHGVYEATDRVDGRVSSVDPRLAHDPTPQSRGQSNCGDRRWPNLLIRSQRPWPVCPRSPRVIAEGISVSNDADLLRRALPRCLGRLPSKRSGGPPPPPVTICRRSSVASFFVSASTPRVDKRLAAVGSADPAELQARPPRQRQLAYAAYEEVFSGDPVRRAGLGAAGRSVAVGVDRCQNPTTLAPCRGELVAPTPSTRCRVRDDGDAFADHGWVNTSRSPGVGDASQEIFRQDRRPGYRFHRRPVFRCSGEVSKFEIMERAARCNRRAARRSEG